MPGQKTQHPVAASSNGPLPSGAIATAAVGAVSDDSDDLDDPDGRPPPAQVASVSALPAMAGNNRGDERRGADSSSLKRKAAVADLRRDHADDDDGDGVVALPGRERTRLVASAPPVHASMRVEARGAVDDDEEEDGDDEFDALADGDAPGAQPQGGNKKKKTRRGRRKLSQKRQQA